MPRPKGSKNKPKTAKATVDFAAQIAEKQAAKEAAAAEIGVVVAFATGMFSGEQEIRKSVV